MLRIAAAADVPAILDIYAPYVRCSTATFEYEPPTLEEFTRRFETITAQYPWLVWEEEGQVLGYAYASAPYTRPAYAWCAEASVYLRPQARGRGIAGKLYGALEAILTAQDYHVLYSLICSENRDSLRFHQKMGYSLRGDFPDCGYKFGRWLGMLWMEKRLKSTDSPRNPPIPWWRVVENDEIMSDILDRMSLS